MNRSLGIPAKIVAGIALCIALSISTSCEYFDPLDPLNRGVLDMAITWEKVMGGNGEDRGMSVEQTIDGGYIITGYTEIGSPGYGNFDVWLIKTDSFGNVEWDETFGGSGDDRGYSGQQTADGGYIIAGYTDSYGAGDSDVWLIKTDVQGNSLWEKTYGGTKGEKGSFVQITSDGGYIITGARDSYAPGDTTCDGWLIKTDSLGNEEWSSTFGDTYSDWGYCVRQTSDGGYIIGGLTETFISYYDAYLVKTDSLGDEEWSKKFGKSDERDSGTCVLQTTDGGYVLAGYTHSYGAGDYDVWMIKTDDMGNEQWDKTFGDGAWDQANSVQPTMDGGYIIAGMTRSGTFGAVWEDVWLIKTDAAGEEQWNKDFGGDAVDYGRSVQQTADGGYIIVGDTNSFSGGTNLFLIYYKP